MVVRGPATATLVLAVLLSAAPGAAQPSGATLVQPPETDWQAAVFRPRPMDFRAPPGDLRRPGEPRRNGLIAAYPVNENVEIGIGRFAVPQIARPRTHMESERHPTAIRARDRGIAALGVSLRF